MAHRARQLGDTFDLQRVLEEVNAVGTIPVSRMHWETTESVRRVRVIADDAGPIPPCPTC